METKIAIICKISNNKMKIINGQKKNHVLNINLLELMFIQAQPMLVIIGLSSILVVELWNWMRMTQSGCKQRMTHG